MSIAETIEHEGYTITLHYDQDPMSPRDQDNVGIMFAEGHRGYELGDEKFQAGLDGEYADAKRAFEHYHENLPRHLIFRAFLLYMKVYHGTTVMLPLGLIDHSGISMYVGGGAHPMDPGGWDSGLVGFIFDTAKRREVTGVAPEQVEEALRIEVSEYDKVLTGDVYGYTIVDPDGDELDDSCWGFIGYEYATQEAKSAVDAAIAARVETPKTARADRRVFKLTVADVNALIGREVRQDELQTVRDALAAALAQPIIDALDPFAGTS
jgi:hypothetical protein